MTGSKQWIAEQVLVLRCQAGDDDAFAELLRLHNPRLRYYLRRMLVQADAADDVLQDVWLSVLRTIGRLHHPAAFRVWIYRIARNAAFARLRQDRRHAETNRDVETVALTASAGDEPEFSPADAARVHAGLAHLRPEHREVLLLRFLEDMSYEQIAEVIGCPLGTVRSRIHYAKLALREQMIDDA